MTIKMVKNKDYYDQLCELELEKMEEMNKYFKYAEIFGKVYLKTFGGLGVFYIVNRVAHGVFNRCSMKGRSLAAEIERECLVAMYEMMNQSDF